MMSNKPNQINADILKALSPEEQKVAMEILRQFAADGSSDLLNSLKYEDFEEIPVEIDTFLDDPKYLGQGIWETDPVTHEKRDTLFPYWRNVLHKLFPDNLTTAYNTLILTGCLAYDTPIPLLNGEVVPIGKLAERESIDEYVYSYNVDTNSYVPGHLIAAFSTGVKPVYKIVLDNGTEIKATSNHKFMTRDKHWKSIDSGLAVGDSLMPFNRARVQEKNSQDRAANKIIKITFFGYEEVFDLTVEKYHNFAIDNGVIVHNSIGLGKAETLDSLILCEHGYKRMGDLLLSDKVFGEDGKLHNILGIFPQGVRPVYRITFTDNTSVDCDENHLWTVCDITRQKWRTMDTKALSQSNLTNSSGYHGHKYKIPITKPVEFEHKPVQIPPYVLGVLIGDGSLSKGNVQFASSDDEIVTTVISEIGQDYTVHKVKEKYSYSIVVNSTNTVSYSAIIKQLNLRTTADNKHIPNEYLYSDVDTRIALLQGLMDTDGHITKDGALIEYTTVSPKLKDDFVFLVQSLGGICHIRTKHPFYKDADGNRHYGKQCFNIGIKLPKNICPFRLTRKVNRLNKRALEPFRYIKSIERIADAECQCIYIDNPTHLYLTNDCIVTHNTFCGVIAQLYLLYRLLCLKDPYAYYGMQPIDKISISMLNVTLEAAHGVGWQKIQALIQSSPWFLDHGHVNASRTEPTWQPNKNIELIYGSSNRHIVGRALFCLDGDTEIVTENGTEKLKNLVLVDKQIKVLSIDNSNNLVLSDCCTVQPTIKTDEEYQIELEDGSIIKCTPEHRFLLTTGEYKATKDLTEADEIAEAKC